jgi:hypothetical protein
VSSNLGFELRFDLCHEEASANLVGIFPLRKVLVVFAGLLGTVGVSFTSCLCVLYLFDEANRLVSPGWCCP